MGDFEILIGEAGDAWVDGSDKLGDGWTDSFDDKGDFLSDLRFFPLENEGDGKLIPGSGVRGSVG